MGTTKPTILIVEDEPSIRIAWTAILEVEYRVVQADTGRLALNLAHTSQPDLILVDVGLPDLSGLEFCRIIRQTPHLQRVPILVISAFSEQRGRQLAMAVGANGYIPKPFSPRHVRSLMETLLGQGEGC